MVGADDRDEFDTVLMAAGIGLVAAVEWLQGRGFSQAEAIAEVLVAVTPERIAHWARHVEALDLEHSVYGPGLMPNLDEEEDS